jgi:hypothetical protein
MRPIVRAALVAACLTSPAWAETPLCVSAPTCGPYAFTLASVSETRSYGVFLVAPDDADCPFVRFRIRRPGEPFLGQSPPLRPGQGVVVRMGRGFAPGEHALFIETSGCRGHPATSRRVTLAKASPDHGWRWSRPVASAVLR